MDSRTRVQSALNWQPVDMAPIEYHLSPGGLYEHGDLLRNLWREHPGDFGDLTERPAPQPDPAHVGSDGSYHAALRDAWGVLWEYRKFGIMGHPAERPLDDLSGIDAWQPAPTKFDVPGAVDTFHAYVAEARKTYYVKEEGDRLFERMIALRAFEDVLVDIALDEPAIGTLADKIVERNLREVHEFLAAGVDAVAFGDDFGTQESLIMSRDTWREFFKPRYQRYFAPVLAARKPIEFHCCGMAFDLLEDFKDLGVDAVWPQIALYNQKELAKKLKDLRLALAIHIDRANVMTKGKPDDVYRAVANAVETYRPREGGSWFYVEIDPGFPRENVIALFDAIHKYR